MGNGNSPLPELPPPLSKPNREQLLLGDTRGLNEQQASEETQWGKLGGPQSPRGAPSPQGATGAQEPRIAIVYIPSTSIQMLWPSCKSPLPPSYGGWSLFPLEQAGTMALHC